MILVIGLTSLENTNVDLIPPMNFKSLSVTFSYPEATTGDMEEYIIFPFEEKISNFPGIKSFSSVSQNGSGEVDIVFPANYTNMNGALVDIKEIIEELRPRLPEGIRNISVKENKQNGAFQNYITLKGVELANPDHDNLIKGFKNKLSSIRGVIDVKDQRPTKYLAIDFNESILREKEITISDAISAIRTYLQYVPLGSIKKGNKKTIIEFKKYDEKVFLDKLKKLPVKTNSFGYTTELQNLAKVYYTYDKHDYITYYDQKPEYGLRVTKDLNSDILKIDEKVRSEIVEFNKNKFKLLAETPISGKGFIVRQLNTLKNNGIFGVGLVILLLILFLSPRSALCTAWGVPIAYAGTFVVIYWAGMSINLLSVVGLIIIAGILVDDALIVTEKYNEELDNGKEPVEAARASVKELFLPVLGTALTTVMAFLPLLLIPSEMGEILKSIPIVIIGALAFSIFECFFILPSHLVSFDNKRTKSLLSRQFDSIKQAYGRLIRYTLNYKYWTVLTFILFSVFSLYYSMDVEKNFNLNIGDEFVMIRGALHKSASKKETLAKIHDLYTYVKKFEERPEIISVESGVGKLWSFTDELIGDKYFEIKAMIHEEYSQPELIKTELENNLKEFIKNYKKNNSDFEFLNVQRNYAGNEEKSDQKYLTFDFYTKSSGVNLDLGNILKTIPEQIEGLGPIEVGNDTKKISNWVFDPNYSVLAQLGITKSQVKDSILGKVQDAWLGESRVDGDAITVYTTIDGKSIKNENFDPKKYFVVTSLGNKISLSSLGEWSHSDTSEKIKHLNAYKMQNAKFPILDSKKRDAVVEKSKDILKKISKQYPQYIIKSSGESLEEEENRTWIINALLSCVIGIYFILVLILGSFLQPVIVCLPILFGVIGVLLAHKLHGLQLGVLSGIGLVGAIGVSVNGSLVMADQINSRLKDTSLKVYDAIEGGALSRFRAILLTSLTTLGGLFPMAYGLGGDSGFTKALAFSMAWGILLASVLTLFFFPAIYAVLNKASEFGSRLTLKK
jgi:multidrug efflux pump subunit AcrB